MHQLAADAALVLDIVYRTKHAAGLGGADGGVIPLHGIVPQNQGPLLRKPAFPGMSQEDQRAKLKFLAT